MPAFAGFWIGTLSYLVVIAIFVSFGPSGCGGSSPANGVAITVSARTVDGSDSTALTATVSNDRNSAGVSWSVRGGGTLSSTSTFGTTYTAPAPSNSALTVTVTATSVADSSKTASATIIVPARPAITAAALRSSAVGKAYSQLLTASGGILPYTWKLTSGTLPACLTITASGSGALIAGTLNASCAGTYSNLVFQVTDSGTPNALTAKTPALTLTIAAAPAIKFGGAMPDPAAIDVAYTGSAAASGGVGALTYSLSGTLPTGLSLNTSSGAVTGTPTAVETSWFTMAAADAYGDSNSRSYSIGVSTPDASPIKHIVVIMQENRTFDNLFNGFPGADSAQSGMNKGTVVPLTPVPLAGTVSLDNSHLGWWKAWDNGKMDGFALSWANDPLGAYAYVQSSDIQPYWTLATQYTLADRMFQSNTGPSFGAHQYLIAGQSGQADENPNNNFFGCDAPAGTTVALIGPNGTDLPGVYPCFDYQTMADLLDANGITWSYYSYGRSSNFEPYEAIRHIFYGNDFKNNIISPQTQVLTDIANGKLAEVTWVTPDLIHSDHPGSNSNEGPDWVASVVNAIGASPFWNSTAIFISWDDWGGWYDHAVPPVIDDMGPGFRVPLIVVSPYAKHGYVSHQDYETASLLTFMEKNFNLPNLGTRDATANDLSDCFDYSQTATPYIPIKTNVSVDVLLHEKPSGPPDDD
jgi:phospholipase C